MARKRAEAAPRSRRTADKSSAAPSPGSDSESPDLLDMDQAIEALKTTRPTFYRWLRAGKIRGMKVGRQWRFYRSEIDRFLKGEEPRIELPADIGPLLKTLSGRLEQIGAAGPLAAGRPDVVRAVDSMILLAIALRASDLHLASHFLEEGAPSPRGAVRVRVDGVLRTEAEFDPRLVPALVDRWKVMASCDLHERTRPQDGRVLIGPRNMDRHQVDIRVSFMPTGLGESLCARILDPDEGAQHLSLQRIRLHSPDRERLMKWLYAPFGMIVVTGPSGCGKTSTLYACIKSVARPELNTITIEDPVEFLLPWTSQVNVRPQGGVTFPVAMRSALRSDPDVVMVGELRDAESARLAHQMALTGHLVLTALHAPEAARALVRLAEVGEDRNLTAEAVKLVVAQRLVRTLCRECATGREPSAEQLARAEELARAGGLDWDGMPKRFRGPVGCSHCGRLGYRGRESIAETLEVTPSMASALRRGGTAEELSRIAAGQGMTTLAADALRMVAEGRTSLEEALRVVGS